MKRNHLLKILRSYEVKFIRHGKNHDVYYQPKTDRFDYIPRHPDINEITAKGIIKNLSRS
jgi:hypothetical protein